LSHNSSPFCSGWRWGLMNYLPALASQVLGLQADPPVPDKFFSLVVAKYAYKNCSVLLHLTHSYCPINYPKNSSSCRTNSGPIK
jgi:hypothetical protein